MTPEIDLMKVDEALVAEAILELREKIVSDPNFRGGKKIASILFDNEEFRLIVETYCRQIKAKTEFDKGVVAATLTVGVQIGHAIALKQLEAAGLKA